MNYKKISIALLGLLLLTACDMKRGSLLAEHTSAYEPTETITRFADALAAKGYVKAGTSDHAAIAKDKGMYLKPTVTLTLSHPVISSALLSCNPSLAMEMPIRIAVYSELGGTVKLAYTQMEYWSLKHNIKDKNCISVVLKMTQDFDIASDAIIKKK